MSRRALTRATIALTTAVALASAMSASVGAAPPPKPEPDLPSAMPLYCDDLPDVLPEAYTCIATESIEILDASGEMVDPGAPVAQLNDGVMSKWLWKREAVIYLNIDGRTVSAVRETQRVQLNGRKSTSTMTMEDWFYLGVPSGPIKALLTQTCIKDNSWFADSICELPTKVYQSTWTTATITNVADFFHASDDLYWWKYQRKIYVLNHRNPATSDGAWYGPEGVGGFVGSSNFNCDQGFPFTEVCRFN